MREILFRGQRVDNQEWVIGFIIQHENITSIIPQDYIGFTDDGQSLDFNYVEVDNYTVEQYIGLNDKNGRMIFEGDKFEADEPGEYFLVSWNEQEARFQVNLYGYNIYYGEGGQEIESSDIDLVDTDCFEISALELNEIIGSIHDKQSDHEKDR